MPNANTIMFIRPKNCKYCIHGFSALKHMVDAAVEKGLRVIDIAEKQAVFPPVYMALKEYDPLTLIEFGHGSSYSCTGDDLSAVITMENADLLKDRITYMHSCWTASALGLKIIEEGGRAYAGFIAPWSWAYTPSMTGMKYEDPLEDPLAKCFYIASNKLISTLIDGGSMLDAYQESYAEYDHWIDHWMASEHPYAGQLIGLLAIDRDRLIIYGEGSAGITPPVPTVVISPTAAMTFAQLPLIGLGITLLGGKR